MTYFEITHPLLQLDLNYATTYLDSHLVGEYFEFLFKIGFTYIVLTKKPLLYIVY